MRHHVAVVDVESASRSDAARNATALSDVQRRRTAALAAAMLVLGAGAALARVPWSGQAPAPCARPALQQGDVLVCDGAGRAAGSIAWLVGQKLDVNAATVHDLEAIPDVGPSLAHAIVDARSTRGGRFASVDELDDVPGIGPKTLAKLARYVDVR